MLSPKFKLSQSWYFQFAALAKAAYNDLFMKWMWVGFPFSQHPSKIRRGKVVMQGLHNKSLSAETQRRRREEKTLNRLHLLLFFFTIPPLEKFSCFGLGTSQRAWKPWRLQVERGIWAFAAACVCYLRSLTQSVSVLAKLVYIQLTKKNARFVRGCCGVLEILSLCVARNMGELRPRKKAAFTSGSVVAIAHIPRW